MNHGLMNGMFWAGVLISAIPVIVSIAAAAFIWRAWQTERAREAADVAQEEKIVP